MEYKISPAAQEYLNQYLDNLEKEIIESASSQDKKNIVLEDVIKSIRKRTMNKSVLIQIASNICSKPLIFIMALFSVVLIGVAITSIYKHSEIFDLDIVSSIFFILVGVLYGATAIFLALRLRQRSKTNKYILVRYWKTLEVYIREVVSKDEFENVLKVVEYIAEVTQNSGIPKSDLMDLLNTRNKIVHDRSYEIDQSEINKQIALYEQIFVILDNID